MRWKVHDAFVFLQDDVTFTTEDKDFIQVGSNFDITVKMQNKSRAVRTVHGSIMLSASYYTGVPLGRVKMQEFDIQLDAIKCKMLTTSEIQYSHDVITGPLWGESASHWWIPSHKASHAELCVFLDVSLNKLLSKLLSCQWCGTP